MKCATEYSSASPTRTSGSVRPIRAISASVESSKPAVRRIRVFGRCVFFGVAVLGFLISSPALATVNVYLAPNAPASLQSDFIAATTSQFIGNLSQSPYFPGTYTLMLSGKNASYVPPVVSSAPLENASAVDEAIAYGFGTGMDTERYTTVNLLSSQMGVDFSSGTCGGVPISTGTITKTMAQSYCTDVYNTAISTISQRWGYIYLPISGIQVP